MLDTLTAVSNCNRQRQVLLSCCSMSCRDEQGFKMVMDTATAISTSASGIAELLHLSCRYQVWLRVAWGTTVCVDRQRLGTQDFQQARQKGQVQAC